MDFYPVSKLRLYADFSQSVFEIAHSHYSVNSFLNAGLRYDFHPRWTVSADLSNLLNRKDYEVSLYQGANFQYYHVPCVAASSSFRCGLSTEACCTEYKDLTNVNTFNDCCNKQMLKGVCIKVI